MEVVMEEFLTVREAAPRLKMSEQALYTAIREGQFPALRIGKRIRIPVSLLHQWIAACSTAPAADRVEGHEPLLNSASSSSGNSSGS
jgi:excisionase family DNA binding protein